MRLLIIACISACLLASFMVTQTDAAADVLINKFEPNEFVGVCLSHESGNPCDSSFAPSGTQNEPIRTLRFVDHPCVAQCQSNPTSCTSADCEGASVPNLCAQFGYLDCVVDGGLGEFCCYIQPGTTNTILTDGDGNNYEGVIFGAEFLRLNPVFGNGNDLQWPAFIQSNRETDDTLKTGLSLAYQEMNGGAEVSLSLIMDGNADDSFSLSGTSRDLLGRDRYLFDNTLIEAGLLHNQGIAFVFIFDHLVEVRLRMYDNGGYYQNFDISFDSDFILVRSTEGNLEERAIITTKFMEWDEFGYVNYAGSNFETDTTSLSTTGYYLSYSDYGDNDIDVQAATLDMVAVPASQAVDGTLFEIAVLTQWVCGYVVIECDPQLQQQGFCANYETFLDREGIVSGLNVTLRNEAQGYERWVTTDQNGKYCFEAVPHTRFEGGGLYQLCLDDVDVALNNYEQICPEFVEDGRRGVNSDINRPAGYYRRDARDEDRLAARGEIIFNPDLIDDNEECDDLFFVFDSEIDAAEIFYAEYDPLRNLQTFNPIVCFNDQQDGTGGTWWQFTGDGNRVGISTCDANNLTTFDTQLQVYAGDCSSPCCVLGNDDATLLDVNATVGLEVDFEGTVQLSDGSCQFDTGFNGLASYVEFCTLEQLDYFVWINPFDALDAGDGPQNHTIRFIDFDEDIQNLFPPVPLELQCEGGLVGATCDCGALQVFDGCYDFTLCPGQDFGNPLGWQPFVDCTNNDSIDCFYDAFGFRDVPGFGTQVRHLDFVVFDPCLCEDVTVTPPPNFFSFCNIVTPGDAQLTASLGCPSQGTEPRCFSRNTGIDGTGCYDIIEHVYCLECNSGSCNGGEEFITTERRARDENPPFNTFANNDVNCGQGVNFNLPQLDFTGSCYEQWDNDGCDNSVSGECGVTTSTSDITTTPQCANNGLPLVFETQSQTRTFTSCFGVSSQTVSIDVLDRPPTVSVTGVNLDCTDRLLVEADPQIAIGTLTVVDQCDGTTIFDENDDLSSIISNLQVLDLCGPDNTAFEVTFQVAVSSNCGKASSAPVQVSVQGDDIEDPQVQGFDATGSCSAVASFTVTDNCEIGAVAFTENTDTTSNQCTDTNIITRIATDSCGNQGQDTATETITDDIVPTFSNVASNNTVVDCNTDLSTLAPTASDEQCNGSFLPLVVTETNVAIIGDGNCGGTEIIRWTASDGCNSISVKNAFTIDLEPVVFQTTPADVTVSCGESTAVINTGIPTLLEGQTCTNAAELDQIEDVIDVLPCEDVITRTWFIDNECFDAQNDFHEQEIHVLYDDTIQVISEPPAVQTQECFGSVAQTFDNTNWDLTWSVDEGCLGVGSVYTMSIPDVVPTESSTCVWDIDVTDGETYCAGQVSTDGNFVNLEQSVSSQTTLVVVDTSAPSFDQSWWNSFREISTNECSAVVDFNQAAQPFDLLPENLVGGVPPVFDDCTVAVATYSDGPLICVGDEGCGQSYEFERTWTVVDECGLGGSIEVQTIVIGPCSAFELVGTCDCARPEDVVCDCGNNNGGGGCTPDQCNCATPQDVVCPDDLVCENVSCDCNCPVCDANCATRDDVVCSCGDGFTDQDLLDIITAIDLAFDSIDIIGDNCVVPCNFTIDAASSLSHSLALVLLALVAILSFFF